jgi:RNA polymerase sigma-70 factor, ECF subfamily
MDAVPSQATTSRVGPVPVGQADRAAEPPAGGADVRQAVEVFLAERARLFAIANRILHDSGDAEDVVQETWVRWQRAKRSEVVDPSAFLATTARRLAINVRQSARARHETAFPPALSELPATGEAPEAVVERTGAIEGALHLLLERLGPAERAAFVLRNGFDYPYPEVAATLALSAPNARQLVSRAHARIRSDRRQAVHRDAHRRLVHAFAEASGAGDFRELETVLTAGLGPRAA